MARLAPILSRGRAAADDIRTPPDYFTFAPPPAGRAYTDPAFGTFILRVTDASVTEDVLDRGPLAYIINEYSTVSAFNRSGSRLLLQHESVFALYDRAGRLLSVLPRDVNSRSEPRWSVHDELVFFYLDGNELRRYDLATGESLLLRRFDEYGEITGRGENDLSFDGDHLALVGDEHEVFLYELSTDTKGAVTDTLSFGTFDQVMVTPDNHVLVGWHAIGPDRGKGLELFDRSMRFVKQVSQSGGHMDVGRDLDGAEIVVRINAADPVPLCSNGIVKVRLGDGVQTCLLTLDWSLASHVSVPAAGSWIFVSTYAPSDPSPEQGWVAHTNEILQVRLDGTEVRRLAHHRSRPFNDYNYIPRLSSSRDGTRLVYSSNFGLQQLLGLPSDYSDVFIIGVPTTDGNRPHRPTG